MSYVCAGISLSVVLYKPDITEIAVRLKTLADKYQMDGISKFVASLKDILTPYNSEEWPGRHPVQDLSPAI